MMSSDRPNKLRGSTCLMSGSCVSPGAAPASGGAASVRLEDIAGAPDGLQVARELRILLDLSPEPGHLDIDRTHVAAELAGLAQRLARDGLADALGERGD